MTAKEQAEAIFRNIPIGKENAIRRPDNKSVDRELRDMISKANAKGALIINVGTGIYIARPWEPEERRECEEYIAKERHRGLQLLMKASRMHNIFERRIGMNHSFSVEIATKYGMLEAILLEHLNFWIAKNKANETNFYDGLYWTYSSTKALSQLFPYVSQKSISRALHHLKDEGLIAFGNYNKSSYDRTMWYALTEKGDLVISGGDLHLSEGKMENPEKENQNSENVQPIPDISTYISTDKSIIENPTDSCPEPEEPAAEPEPEEPSAEPEPEEPSAEPEPEEPSAEPEPEEPSAEPEPPFITLPLNTGEEHPVTAGDVEEYKELYPAVNIEQALRSMRGWLLSNPGRRKTARGIRRFINSWLSREQDRGGNMRAPARAARSDLEAWANG